MFQSDIKQHLVILILLAALGLAAGGATLSGPFLHEDTRYILDDPRTESVARAWQGLSLEDGFRQPVLFFTYAVDRALGGGSAWAFHLTNVLIHVAAGWVLYLLLVEATARTRDRPKSEWAYVPAVAAGLHLIHPLNVQAVAYLSDRGHLLSTLLALLAVWGVARFARLRQDAPKSFTGPAWMLAAVVFFVLAVGTHPAAVCLPVVAVVYLILFGNDPALKKELKIGLFVLIPILLYMAWRAPVDPSALTADGEAPGRWDYLASQIQFLWFYYGFKYLLPFNLNFAPDAAVGGLGDPGVWAAVALTGAVAWGAWRQTQSPLLRFGLIWAGVAFLANSALVPISPPVSEARFYLPGVGLHLAVAWALARLLHRVPRRTLPFAAALGAVLLTLTVLRGMVFSSEESLWRDVLSKSPGQPVAALRLASFYEQAEKMGDAQAVLEQAIAVQPDSESLRLRLGLLYMKQKRFDPAIEQFEAAIRGGTQNPVAYYNAGLALVEQKRGAQAVPFLERIIQGENLPGKYYYLLGRAYHQAGRLDDALKQLRLAVKKDPGNALAYNRMGEVYWDMKSYFFADVAFQQAYQADNASVPILNNLISSSMLMKHYVEAIEYCDRLLEIDADNPNARQWKIAAERFLKTEKKEETPAVE
ncbi:tetratricopeptide repeat protein [Nitrospina gracilis]|uniref:tetratricopeptide repeat protein n=1 Tax=Nitrospina gracilis TaxID=35801 RepID=UPI001F1C18A5|nr:tetratricopeptide (TPR) repeat protein [Nitrospina gracilis Nb-211]